MVMKEMEKGGGVFNGFQIQEVETRTLLKQRVVLRSASEDLTHSKESCEKDCIRKTKKYANFETCLFTPSDIDLLLLLYCRNHVIEPPKFGEGTSSSSELFLIEFEDYPTENMNFPISYL